MVRIVCVSDSHEGHRQLVIPPADLLVHAGDWTLFGEDLEVTEDFVAWLAAQPVARRVVIAGNHELLMGGGAMRGAVLELFAKAGITYLEDSGVESHGLCIWGTPWQPTYGHLAFNLDTEAERAAKWALIPEDTDLLLCHGPPFGVRDWTDPRIESHKGCKALAARVGALPRLAALVCGHIHEAAGAEVAFGGVAVVNAAVAGGRHRVARQPLVLTLTPGTGRARGTATWDHSNSGGQQHGS